MSSPYNERTACPGCPRKFRDTDSLVKHLSHNPGHGVYERWSGKWVIKRYTVETFRRLPETPDGQSVQVSHDAASNSIWVDGLTVLNDACRESLGELFPERRVCLREFF